MAITTLVESDIKRGKEALKALDQARVTVRAAFWRYLPEAAEWRLVLATPLVDRKGARAAYERIENVLKKAGAPVPLWQITVTSTSDRLVEGLRHAIRTTRQTEGIRLTNSVIDNTLVEDAYIYRSA